MHKFFWILAASLVFFTSCHPSRPRARTDRKLRTIFRADPQTLDARKSSDLLSASLHFLIYAGLMEIQSDGTLKCSLAQSYSLSKDLKTYTFYLKENLHWSNGEKLTAGDFERSFKEALTPAYFSASSTLFYPIKNAKKAALGQISTNRIGVKALNERILQIKLERPTPHFLYLTAFSTYFPMPKTSNVKTA
ncbi:MAG: ABC transporter substrate-binding protein, partial [Parachlamydiales bacterium]